MSTSLEQLFGDVVGDVRLDRRVRGQRLDRLHVAVGVADLVLHEQRDDRQRREQARDDEQDRDPEPVGPAPDFAFAPSSPTLGARREQRGVLGFERGDALLLGFELLAEPSRRTRRRLAVLPGLLGSRHPPHWEIDHLTARRAAPRASSARRPGTRRDRSRRSPPSRPCGRGGRRASPGDRRRAAGRTARAPSRPAPPARPGGAAHQRCGNSSSWCPSAHSMTKLFLPRTNHVGAEWLGRSVTSGRARQMARRRVRRSEAMARRYRPERVAAAVLIDWGRPLPWRHVPKHH